MEDGKQKNSDKHIRYLLYTISNLRGIGEGKKAERYSSGALGLFLSAAGALQCLGTEQKEKNILRDKKLGTGLESQENCPEIPKAGSLALSRDVSPIVKLWVTG